MSAATRLPTIAGVVAAAAALIGATRIASVREYVEHHLGSSALRSSWRFLLLLLALVNFKNLPGLWHVRGEQRCPSPLTMNLTTNQFYVASSINYTFSQARRSQDICLHR